MNELIALRPTKPNGRSLGAIRASCRDRIIFASMQDFGLGNVDILKNVDRVAK